MILKLSPRVTTLLQRYFEGEEKLRPVVYAAIIQEGYPYISSLYQHILRPGHHCTNKCIIILDTLSGLNTDYIGNNAEKIFKEDHDADGDKAPIPSKPWYELLKELQ